MISKIQDSLQLYIDLCWKCSEKWSYFLTLSRLPLKADVKRTLVQVWVRVEVNHYCVRTISLLHKKSDLQSKVVRQGPLTYLIHGCAHTHTHKRTPG